MENVQQQVSEENSVPLEKEKLKAAKSKTKIAPPTAPAIPATVFSKWGLQLCDDFSWLNDRTNPKVLKYLEEENAFAESKMQHTRELQDTLYYEFCGRYAADERSTPIMVDNFFYYTRIDTDHQYKIHCRKFETMDSEEHILLDENSESQGEDYFYLGAFQVSPDHSLVCYSVDTEGNERFSLRFKNLTTGLLLEDEIYPSGGQIAWAADNRTIFYTKMDSSGRTASIWRHVLSENAYDGSDDEQVFIEEDVHYSVDLLSSTNNKYFLVKMTSATTSEYKFLSKQTPRGELSTILPRTEGNIYDVDNHGSYFFMRTNDKAKNFKILKVPVDDPQTENWEEVVACKDDVYIERMEVYRHHLVTWEWQKGFQQIRIQDLSDGETHYVQIGDGIYSLEPIIDESVQDNTIFSFNSNIIRFKMSSFLQPPVIFMYDMDNRRKRKVTETKIPGFIKDQYVQKRVYAKSKDVDVPLTLVYKISLRNVSVGNPLVLTGYGAYASNSRPTWNEALLSLLDRGFVFAMAHIRGETNLGWRWYEEGKLFKKKNVFYDFIACAEYLIEEGYTTNEKLAALGNSAGGMVVCAAVNFKPDLFGVVVADVPYVDVFGSVIDKESGWSPYECLELGDPNNSQEAAKYILSYSPYQCVESKSYPHMLITAGWNDSRISFAEPTKYVAKLRKLKTDSNLLLLKTSLASGHRGASGRFSSFEEIAFMYAFLIDRLAPTSIMTTKLPLMKVSPSAVAPPDILTMMQSYLVTMTLDSALELELFNYLHSQPNFQADCKTLAKEMNVPTRGLRRVLDALVAVGILARDEEHVYMLTQIAVAHLVKGMPGYIGELRSTLVNDFQWKAMTELTESVRKGEAVVPISSTKVSAILAESNEATYRHAAIELEAVLSQWIRKKKLTVLDLNCGNGLMGYTLLTKHPKLKLYTLDSPEALSIAKKNANEMNLAGKVEYIPCEDIMKKDNIGGPYDLVIFGQNLFNSMGYSKSLELLQKVSEVLKSTGRLVLQETMTGTDVSPTPHLQSVTMFATQKTGKVHSVQWYKDLMIEAGFSTPSVHSLSPFPEKLLVSNRNIIAKSKKEV